MDVEIWLLLAGGVFALLAAWRDWDWFFAHPKARVFLRIVGRSGARILYAVIGAVLVIAGCMQIYANSPFREQPVVIVTAFYPGADPQTVLEHVANPLKQELIGTEGMESFELETIKEGTYTARIRFRRGFDPQSAYVLVSNRVQLTKPRLPNDVKQAGVTVEIEALQP